MGKNFRSRRISSLLRSFAPAMYCPYILVASLARASNCIQLRKFLDYVLKAGKLRFTLSDGTLKDVELTEGQVTSGAGSHVVENIGETTVRVLQIEFKD